MAPRHLFVYGSLLDPQCLAEVLGHRHRGERLAARLRGYRRSVSSAFAFPYLVPAAHGSLDGVLLMDLSLYDFQRLDRYEEVDSGVYKRQIVEVEAWGCGPTTVRFQAHTSVAGPGLIETMQDKVVYLTPEGKQRFTAELHELQTVRRHEVEEQIRRAKEFSDTVDNAEYDEAKTEQAFVEGRILELERLLASAKVIEESATRADYVRMGAHVKVAESDGEEVVYYLVGSHEADPRRGLVSNESPIGRALLGKRVGDEVTVVAPAGAFTLKILEIS